MMRLLILLSLCLITLLQGYWLLAVCLITWVAYWHQAWGLFVVAVLVDGYLGMFSSVPLLSLTLGAFVLWVEAFKLYLVGTNS